MAEQGCVPANNRDGAGESDDDSVISAKIKALFLEEPNLSYEQIDVETCKGVVRLTGFVNSRVVINRALEIVLGVKGVNSVENEILRK